MGVVAGALVCVGCVAAPSFAQSLADVARHEREKQRQRCVSRVLTNEDLTRPEVLSDKDRACLEAAREAPPAPAAAPFSTNADIRPLYGEPLTSQPIAPPFHLDSLIFPFESALPDFPLAAIAPYDREMKAARIAREAQLQKAAVVRVPPGRSRLHAAAPAPGVAPSIPQFRLPPAPLDAGLPPAPFAPAPPREVPGVAPARIEFVRPVHVVVPDGAATTEAEVGPSAIRVERGDSLWKIAARHLGSGSRWRAVVALNPHISDPNLIRIGDVLRLPLESSNLKSELGSTAPSEMAASKTQSRSASVRVVLGDTLWALARTQFGRGTAWTCIAQANQLPDPDLILPGQTLTLPELCQ